MLLNKIKEDQLDARKNKDTIKISVLTLALSDIIRVGKDNGNRETTEDEAVLVIKKHIKYLDENLALTLEENEKFEFSTQKIILESYLPTQATVEDIKQVMLQNPNASKGEIFKILKSKFGNNFDGKMVPQLFINI